MHTLRRPPRRIARQTNKDIQVSLLGNHILVMGATRRGQAWLAARFDDSTVKIPVKDWLSVAQSICDSGLTYQDTRPNDYPYDPHYLTGRF